MKFLARDELPACLVRLENTPKGLYAIGDVSLLNLPKVAVVGSRKASVYTKECVRDLCTRLKNAGV